MKSLLKPTAVLAAMLIASLSMEAAPAQPSPRVSAAPLKDAALPSTPAVVSAQQPLSAGELAKYQQKDAKFRSADTAGADDATTWWIVGGVVVVVGVIALAAGGGHGGSGGRILTRFGPVALGGLAALLALGGCSSVRPFTGLPLDQGGLFVNGVTPIRQDRDFTCGPACVAAVATRWGVTPAQFKAAAGPVPVDATARDLQALAARLGLQAFVFDGSMDDLRENLGKGRPVIAMIAMPLLPRGDLLTAEVLALWDELGPRPAHWVVVVGTIGRDWVILDDPASGALAVKADRFQKWWERHDRMAVLITGPAPWPAIRQLQSLGSAPGSPTLPFAKGSPRANLPALGPHHYARACH